MHLSKPTERKTKSKTDVNLGLCYLSVSILALQKNEIRGYFIFGDDFGNDFIL